MRKIYLFLILLMLGGCIENDIPFPVISGDVKTIVFQGQKDVKIDPVTRTINLTLNDDVDLRSIELKELTITDDARTTLDVGTVIDFSRGSGLYAVSAEPITFVISTYQDYEWKIVCTQPLDLKVDVQGSIGPANIDAVNRIAIIKVPVEHDLYSIVVTDYCLAPTGAVYTPDLYTITDFNRRVEVVASFFGISQTWSVEVQRSMDNVVTGAANPWAMFAHLSGNVQSGTELATGFDYKRKTASEWSYVEGTAVGGNLSATVTDLMPNTEYVYRARLGDQIGQEKDFRTEPAPVIPNMNFEDWAAKGITWYPSAIASDEDPSSYWSTGNVGVTSPLAGGKPSNTSPSTDAKSGEKAALIETIKVPVVDLAAGSLFTGKFVLTIAAPLNSPKFSRPYVGRPTALSFWYKYDPKVIEVVRNGAPVKVGDMDHCNIYIYLGDWQGELLSSELKKENTRGVIAYGAFTTDQKVDTYTQQTIDIKYYDTERPVTKILIVASSSACGDQYTGGVGSKLLLDDLQFHWQAPMLP